MNKITKIISVIVAVVMILTLAVFSYAADTFTVSANDVTTNAGKDVKVIVSIDKNPGVVAFQLKAEYDTQYLTLKSSEKGSALTTFDYTIFNMTNSPISIGGVVNVESNADAETANNKKTGEIAVLTFSVAENAPEGQYPIEITITKCVNYQNETVSTSAKSAVVKVMGETEPTTPPVTTEKETTTKPPVTTEKETTTKQPPVTTEKETTTKPVDDNTTTTKPIDSNTTTTEKPTTTTTTKKYDGGIPATGDSSIGTVIASVCILAGVAFVATKKKEK